MSVQLSERDLEFVFELASKRFINLGTESLSATPLTHRQQVCISYIDAVMGLLVKRGVMTTEQLPTIPLVAADSEPQEYDYE